MGRRIELAPLWSLAELNNSPRPPQGELVSLDRIEGGTGRLNDEKSSFTAEGRAFETGDVLFGKLRPYLAKYWLADKDGTAQGDIHIYHPSDETEPRFLAYIVGSNEFIRLAVAASTGTKMPRVEWSKVAQFRVPAPPLPTQRAIADYLDRETAEIDGMRADLDEIKQLLTERRAAIISEALFKGGHEGPANSEPTDGVNCLAPLWKFAEVSPPTPEFAKLTEDDKVTFIPLEDIWPSYAAGNFQTVNWQPRLTGYTPFRRGDLLVPKVTPTVTHGRTMIANIATDVGVASTEVYTLRARPSTNPRWMAHLLVGTEFLGLAGASVQGTGGLKRISTQFVESYPLPNIELDEQRRIADEIDRETAEIDSMLSDITKLRDLLAERRTALISAAVTGQIDIPVSPTHKDEAHA